MTHLLETGLAGYIAVQCLGVVESRPHAGASLPLSLAFRKDEPSSGNHHFHNEISL